LKDNGSSNGFGNGDQKRLSDKASQTMVVLSTSRIRRFEEIWKALKAGTYRVDGRQVAEKMVSDAVRRLREQIR